MLTAWTASLARRCSRKAAVSIGIRSVRRIDSRPGYLVLRTWRIGRSLLAASHQHGDAHNGQQNQRGFHWSAACQRAASRATLAGAVPPKLRRDATEASTVSTVNR